MKNLIAIITLFIMCTLVACKSDEVLVLNDGDSMGLKEYYANQNETVNNSYLNSNDNNRKIAEDQNDFDKNMNDSMLSFVVYVCGAVKNPGVYELNENARVIEAIEAAGGFSNDASIDYLNLAKTVADGEKIYIPTSSEVDKYIQTNQPVDALINPENNSDNNQQNSKVNINIASESELTSIPGVGPSKAKAIISYREQNGKFNKIEDIMKITGIKDGLFNKVKDYICVN